MIDDERTHRLITAAGLVAAGVAVGYLMAPVPNVEGISAVGFFAGYKLGARLGALVGGLAMGLFSVLNPLGPPVPHVLLAQVVGVGLIGASGRLWGILAPRVRSPEGLAAGMGAVLTLVATVMSDYAFAVSIGKWRNPLPVLAVGVPFSAVRVVTNGLIFAGLGVFLVRMRRPADGGGT
jgi:hypothetical protein